MLFVRVMASIRGSIAAVVVILLLNALFVAREAHAKDMPGLEQKCPEAATWIENFHQRMHVQKQVLEAIRPSDPELAKQLSQRAARDQAARDTVFDKTGKPIPSAFKEMLIVDKNNLTWLKPLVEAHGFPTLQKVGLKGVENAWLLVQHADRDPTFQAKVLAELKPRLRTQPFLRSDYALLTDRVLLALHKRQIYGTQFDVKNGRLVLRPTKDLAGLPQRRAEKNLMPLRAYRCFIGSMYRLSTQGAAPTPATHPKP